jgi:uncharacterized protein (DUF2164 family)
MTKIEFTKQARDAILKRLTRYLKEEMDLEASGFDVVFLLDFISEELGPYYYNQGLYDAQAIFLKKVEVVGEAVYEIEKPIKGF